MGNWDLCKEVGAYGIPKGRKAAHIRKGDSLLFWIGGQGYVALARVAGPPRVPGGKEDAPWPGGTYQYGYIVPFDITTEVRKPVYLPFDGQFQQRTGISKAQLQHSCSVITEEAGVVVLESLVERLAQEDEVPHGE